MTGRTWKNTYPPPPHRKTVSNKEAILVHKYHRQVTTHRNQIVQGIINYTLAGNLLWEERYVQTTTTADQAQEEHPGHQTTDLYHPYIVK